MIHSGSYHKSDAVDDQAGQELWSALPGPRHLITQFGIRGNKRGTKKQSKGNEFIPEKKLEGSP